MTSLGLIVAIINREPAQYDGDGEAIHASTSQAAKDFSPLSVSIDRKTPHSSLNFTNFKTHCK